MKITHRLLVSLLLFVGFSSAFAKKNLDLNNNADMVADFAINTCYKNVKNLENVVYIARKNNWEPIPDEYFKSSLGNYFNHLIGYDGWFLEHKKREFMLVVTRDKYLSNISNSKYNFTLNNCILFDFSTPIELLDKALKKRFKNKLIKLGFANNKHEIMHQYLIKSEGHLFLHINAQIDNGNYDSVTIQFSRFQ
jgi:hypothetical protein